MVADEISAAYDEQLMNSDGMRVSDMNIPSSEKTVRQWILTCIYKTSDPGHGTRVRQGTGWIESKKRGDSDGAPR